MIKHKLRGILLSVMMMFMLTGCTTEVIELTDKEEVIISEYAAHAILENMGVYQRKIIDEMLVEETEDEVQDLELKEEVLEEQETEDILQVVVPDSFSENTVSVNSDMTIEDFFGMEGLQIVYKDYAVVKTFPEETEEDFYLSIDATENNNLLVLKFDAVNQTETDYTADMMAYGLKFKIGVNDASPRWVLSTMLLNDMTTYSDVIMAGESVELVLAIEIPEETTVEQLSLVMKKGDNSFTKTIK